MATDFVLNQLNDDTLVIVTGTNLDNNNAHELLDTISSIQQRGFRYIVIDMRNCEFLSSAGVGSIIGTVEISREMGGDIILCNLTDPIRHVLKVLDLDDFLTIEKDIQAAVARFEG